MKSMSLWSHNVQPEMQYSNKESSCTCQCDCECPGKGGGKGNFCHYKSFAPMKVLNLLHDCDSRYYLTFILEIASYVSINLGLRLLHLRVHYPASK